MIDLDQYISELGQLKKSRRLEILKLIEDSYIREELIRGIFQFLSSWEMLDITTRKIESDIKYQSVEQIVEFSADVRSIFGKNEEKFTKHHNTNDGGRIYIELFVLAYLGKSFSFICKKFDELRSNSHIGKIA